MQYEDETERLERIRKASFFIWAAVDCLDLFALNVSTDFASKNFVLFAKVLRTLVLCW